MKTKTFNVSNSKFFLIDLIIYISVMFLIREVYFPKIGFIANGLFWSFTTLIVATWRMRIRNISWRDLGLRKPQNIFKTIIVAIGILAAVPIAIIIFHKLQDVLPFTLNPDTSSENATLKFGKLKGNWQHFFIIIPFVLLQSTLEELLDRGFLINWFERVFSSSGYATTLAVISQAFIFGFRHSYDISERSITVAIIGLLMGIAYVKFGRNLWALIIAHCVLNSISMIGRVL